MSKHALKVTHGVAGGMTVQFAEGHWPGEIGSGVEMSDEAFDLIEPFVEMACADWTSAHRYGVFKLSRHGRKALAVLLRHAAASHDQRILLAELAEWLEARGGDDRPVSILGY